MSFFIQPKYVPRGSAAMSWLVVFLPLAWLCSIPAACLFGPYPASAAQVLEAFCQLAGLGGSEETNAPIMMVVGKIRLARAVAALLCGGMLGVAGVALQGALRNPLADPFTLGISTGAACGASLAIALPLPGLAGFTHAGLISAAALAGALLALGATLLLARNGGEYRRETVILAGIAVAAFMGVLVALIKSLNEESVASIVFWLMGSLQGVSFSGMWLMFCLSIPGLLICLYGWRKLDALMLGDEEAASLGINPGAARLLLLGGASCMTAGCVAVCGIIGFVGLVVPHMLRLMLGAMHGPLLICSFFAGGLLLLGADCIARCVLDSGQELPVGVVTALAGGPFFAFLVRSRM